MSIQYSQLSIHGVAVLFKLSMTMMPEPSSAGVSRSASANVKVTWTTCPGWWKQWTISYCQSERCHVISENSLETHSRCDGIFNDNWKWWVSRWKHHKTGQLVVKLKVRVYNTQRHRSGCTVANSRFPRYPVHESGTAESTTFYGDAMVQR